jgi:transposase
MTTDRSIEEPCEVTSLTHGFEAERRGRPLRLGSKLRTGAPWRDVPERYGPWQTCADRLYRWRREGLWDRLLAHIQTKSDAVGEIVWEVSIDSSTARAHQHASGARRRRSRADEKN